MKDVISVAAILVFMVTLAFFSGLAFAGSDGFDNLPPAPIATGNYCSLPAPCLPVQAVPQACVPVTTMPQACMPVQAAPAPCAPAMVPACSPVQTSCTTQTVQVVQTGTARVGLLATMANGLNAIKSHHDDRVVSRCEHRIAKHQKSSTVVGLTSVNACSPVGVVAQPACVGCGG